MPQGIVTVDSALPHENMQASSTGKKRLTTGSVTLPDGGGPFVAYAIPTDPQLNPTPVNGTARPTGVRVRRVSPEVAAQALVTGARTLDAATPADPRLATEAEIAASSLKTSYSNAAVATAPDAPTFSSILATSVRVNWIAPALGNPTSYKVERAPDAADSPGAWTEIATGVAAIFRDVTGLTTATKYHFRVRATNANGDSAYSPSASVTTA